MLLSFSGKPQKGRIDEKKKKKYSSAVFPHDAVMVILYYILFTYVGKKTDKIIS